MQIVGKTFDDLSVFRAAAAYEKARPGAEGGPRLKRWEIQRICITKEAEHERK